MRRCSRNIMRRASRRKLYLVLTAVAVVIIIIFIRFVYDNVNMRHDSPRMAKILQTKIEHDLLEQNDQNITTPIIPKVWKKDVNTGSKSKLNRSIIEKNILPDPTQEEIDYIATHVKVQYDVKVNFSENYFIGGYSFINTGSRPIPAKRWQLYFYSMSFINTKEYPYPCGLKIFHFTGQLYWFEPVASDYEELIPGATITCQVKRSNTHMARSDSMPNWYVVGNDLLPKIISNTQGEALLYVGGLLLPNQYLRRPAEKHHPYLPAERYNVYRASAQNVSNPTRVLPTPLEIITDDKDTLIWNTNEWVIVSGGPFPDEAKYLSEQLKMKQVGMKPAKQFVVFVKGDVDVSKYKVIKEEAYTLTSDTATKVISITAPTPTGAFYAVQTLMSLVFAPEAGTVQGIMHIISSFTVKDAPRYSYRGLHVDVSRNFHGPEQMKRTMAAMAMYKMNKLHLHLSDDEGWRLEIPGMPELIQIGSRRCHDPEEEQCIMPMLGSGPYTNTSGTGYFDVGEYRDLLKYAKGLHIEVIPEIDMPGHSQAAIRSIHAKSQKSHRVAMKAEIYDVIDESDKGSFLSPQSFSGNVINPCMSKTYKYVDKILSSLQDIYKDVQSLKVFHFGGDEVPKNAWATSEVCKNLTKERPELKSHFGKMKYFIQEVSELVSKRGMSLAAWEDGMIAHPAVKKTLGTPFPRNQFENKDILVYVWKKPLMKSTPHRLRLLANNGYKVILAYGSHLYFDHPYEADPEERGLYWATRKISLQDVWEFSSKISEGDMKLKCPAIVHDKTDCFKLKKPENIAGIEANLWSETVRTDEQVDFMLFPRLLAVAERAWHKSPWEDKKPGDTDKKAKDLEYAAFVNLIGSQELRRLDMLGVNYRVPPPGARVADGKVMFRTEFPGLDIEYFIEAEKTWKIVQHNMPITGPLKIRTRSFDGKRFSRIITVKP